MRWRQISRAEEICNPGSNAAILCGENLLSVRIHTTWKQLYISVMNDGKSTSMKVSCHIFNLNCIHLRKILRKVA